MNEINLDLLIECITDEYTSRKVLKLYTRDFALAFATKLYNSFDFLNYIQHCSNNPSPLDAKIFAAFAMGFRCGLRQDPTREVIVKKDV